MTAQEFASKYGAQAIDATDGSTVFAIVVLSAAALESGWGTSGLSSNHNNFFGIKAGKSWSGKSVTMRTREVIDGKSVYVNEPFRKYASAKDSFEDYIQVISRPRYVNAGVLGADTPEAQFQAIQAGGYATDPQYAVKLISVMRKLLPYMPAAGTEGEKKN